MGVDADLGEDLIGQPVAVAPPPAHVVRHHQRQRQQRLGRGARAVVHVANRARSDRYPPSYSSPSAVNGQHIGQRVIGDLRYSNPQRVNL